MDLYRETIIGHYKHPQNFGHLDGADITVSDTNPSCGDRISVEIRFSGTGPDRKVTDIRFTGEGCAIHQASASMLTESVKQKSTADILKMDLDYVQKLLGTTLTPSRVKCALLPLETIQKAVQQTL